MADKYKKMDEELKQTDKKQTNQQNIQVADEDDDDFEEFQNEDWGDQNLDDKIDVKYWREDWDDEDIQDEFTQQLKSELKL